MFLLNATIEEIGDMGILLRLGKTIVMHANLFPNFRQNIFMIARRKSNGQRKRSVIDCETNEFDLRAAGHLKLLEAWYRQCSRKLARSIRSEVKKDHRIAIFNCCHRLSSGVNDYGRLDKLVSDSPIVGPSDCGDRIGSWFAFAFDQELISA